MPEKVKIHKRRTKDMRVSANGAFAYVDYIVALSMGYRKEALIYSCFERSEIALRGFTANISLSGTILYLEDDRKDMVYFPETKVESYHTKMMRGKEPINHSLSIWPTLIVSNDKANDFSSVIAVILQTARVGKSDSFPSMVLLRGALAVG